MTQQFTPIVEEKLHWYVYALIDPRDSRLFYIGKGKGNRVFTHARHAVEGDVENEKLDLIREIIESGKEVETVILRHAIPTENQAYLVESVLIDFCSHLVTRGMDLRTGLANLVAGHHADAFGVMSAQDIENMYHAPQCEEITEKAILFRIPAHWSPAMPPEDLYEATHGWWKLGAKRNEAQYGFAVSCGVIRAIYRIESWRQRAEGDRGFEAPGDGRWGFEGSLVTTMDQYLNKSVTHLFKQGAANPCTYTF
ncbi:MAG: hypothetical protein RL524_903 [Actinomycetota bacterium]|jgi:hypothetical protein